MQKRNRGRCYPDMTAALKSFLASGIPQANLHAVHIATADDPGYYGAPPQGLSIEALRNLAAGKAVMPQTVRIVRNFLAINAADLLPPETLESVPLNLPGFFGMPPDKLRLYGGAINGSFQTYAISTTVPDMVRRGRMTFTYDPRLREIQVSEKQYRPAIKRMDETQMEWHGYCAARGNKYFAVLRTNVDCSESTPLFYIFDTPESVGTRNLNRLRGVSMGLDPRQNWPSFPTVYLERVKAREDIIIDFCAKKEITQDIIDKISLTDGSLL